MDRPATAFITGANSGIGNAISKYLEESGYKITAIDKKISKEYAHSTNLVQLDLSKSETLLEYLKEIKEPVDIVINCAGIREICPLIDLTFKKWREVMSINIDAAFILSQHFSKLALEHGKACNIINISSISGFQAEPNRNAYIASKHALIGLTKSMAYELGEHGIRVNSIAPGIVETELTAPYFKDLNTRSLIIKNTPLKKWGQVDNIVQTVDFILKNDFITGEVIVIDGGWTIGKDL